jgi:hypothetical protein
MRLVFLMVSYLALGSCGALVFVATPSSSLVDQGGTLVVYSWGVICLVGGISGALGMIIRRRPVEVLGAALGVTASLTWCLSLILQAVSTENAVPLTAACMAASLAGMFAQRCVGGKAAATHRRKGPERWWWHRRTR